MPRRLLVVLAGAVVGALIGLVATLLQDEVYRADGSIAIARQGVAPGSDPALAASAEAAAELFESRAVAESVVANLRLDDTPEQLLERVEVTSEPGSSLVRIEVEADEPEEARQAAQNVAEVATVLFNDRFGPETSASVWEAARADEDPVSARPLRVVGVGALLGALAGLLLTLLVRRGDTREGEDTNMERERVLQARVDQVTRRELELARRAAALAARERGVEEPALAVADPVEADPALGAEPAWEPEPAPPPLPADPAAVTLWRIEKLVADHPSDDVFVQTDREATLFLLRDYVGIDGRIPPQFEALVDDTFGDLLGP